MHTMPWRTNVIWNLNMLDNVIATCNGKIFEIKYPIKCKNLQHQDKGLLTQTTNFLSSYCYASSKVGILKNNKKGRLLLYLPIYLFTITTGVKHSTYNSRAADAIGIF